MLTTLRTFLAVSLACAALAGCDPMGEDVVGPEGGTVTSRDGRLTIDIPAGALDDALEITIEEVDELPDGALGPAYVVLPVGTTFRAPVHVIYNFSDAQGMDIDQDDIALVVERTDSWRELADRTLLEEQGIISASALYLSTFCIVDEG